MRRRERRVGSLHAGTMAKSFVGAGVAVSVPATGAVLAAAPAHALAPSAPKATSGAASAPRLSFGSSGAAVKLLQARVGVSADGVFGPQTLAAVKRFQSAHGLVPDGIVGPLTWAQVGSTATTSTRASGNTSVTKPATTTRSSSTPMSCASSSTTLRYGSSGQLVKVLQSRVGLTPSGFFGSATQQAVMGFQSAHGLAADGVVGPLTWSKLGCASATTSPQAPAGGHAASGSSGTTATPATPTASGSSVINVAKRYIGVPYVWGGSTPSGFDCSGFTSYVFKQFGVYMPRTAAQQQAHFRAVSTPQVGDLIFYGYPAYHVAIYVGNGLMIDAAHPGSYVGIRSMYGDPAGFARVI